MVPVTPAIRQLASHQICEEDILNLPATSNQASEARSPKGLTKGLS